jgi:predicted dehydrogenase
MPIRTAIIGLSSSGQGWASNAHLPYLSSDRGREVFFVVAVCNSSEGAARHAIKRYQFPPETKAYGDPQALAEDTNVDLVVFCTRVDVHYNRILPSVKAGKDIYLEWPLANNSKRSQELVEAARKSGSKTIVGLQGRFAPALEQIEALISQGRIGSVLSAEVRATGASYHPAILPERLKCFTDWKIGGNI